jgi:transcriptional regulator with XRE-family HTH domain
MIGSRERLVLRWPIGACFYEFRKVHTQNNCGVRVMKNIVVASTGDVTEIPQQLFTSTRRALGNALFRAMQVAGETESEYPVKLSQEALSAKSGVARSTIAKYLEAKSKDCTSVNPDLKTLCKLATALNVPPALLLLTPEDWSKLAQAATYLVDAVPDARVQRISMRLAQERSGAAERGNAGLELAKLFGVYQSAPRANSAPPDDSTAEMSPRWSRVHEDARRKQRLGILVATSIPPLREFGASQYAPILSLCANLGASTSHHGDENG